VRRSLVGLVLVLAVLGAGCSSQPSALTTARQSAAHWSAVINADYRAEQAACPLAKRTGVDGRCTVPPGTALFDKMCPDEQHWVQALKAEDHAEAKPYSGPDIPSCRKLAALDRIPYPSTPTPGRT
jgi:hypothetical protein